MFDQLPSSGRRSGGRTLVISLSAHLAVLLAIVIAPLVFYRELHWTAPELPAILWTTPPPPPPPIAAVPPPPAVERTAALQLDPSIPSPDHFVFTPPPPPGDLPTTRLHSAAPPGAVGSLPGQPGVPTEVLGAAGGPPPPPPPPVEPPRPIRVSVVMGAKLVHRVDPEYPELARRARVEGIVIVQLLIDRDGRVRNVKLVRGHPLLNQAAEDAVRQWRYEATLLNGEPVEVLATVTVQFRLR